MRTLRHTLIAATLAGIAVAGAATLPLAAQPIRAAIKAPPGAESCFGCHAEGEAVGIVPSLRGIKAEALREAMAEYRADKRPATVMNRIAKGFSEAEIRDIAAWLEARP